MRITDLVRSIFGPFGADPPASVVNGSIQAVGRDDASSAHGSLAAISRIAATERQDRLAAKGTFKKHGKP